MKQHGDYSKAILKVLPSKLSVLKQGQDIVLGKLFVNCVTPFRVSLLVTFICLTLIDLETTSKQTSGGAGTSHYPASTGKLGPFLHDNGQQQRTMVHLKSRAKHQGL